MQRSRFLAVLALAFAAPMAAHASEPVQVGEFVSHPGEPLEDWLIRIAPEAMRYTLEHGHEVCGVVGQDETGEQFALRLVSSRGALTCATTRSNQAEGFRPLRATFHTHPSAARVLPTQADVEHFHKHPSSSGRAVLRQRPERVGGKSGQPFSDADYSAGPGYLVSHGALFFQSGRGTEREVGKLPEALAAR